MSDRTHHRARVASLTRSRPVDDPELVDARRSLKAAALAEHIAKTVDSWPELLPDQRDRLALLLRGDHAPPGPQPARKTPGSTSGEQDAGAAA